MAMLCTGKEVQKALALSRRWEAGSCTDLQPLTVIATVEYRGRTWHDVNLRRVFNRIRNWNWSSQLRHVDDDEQGYGNQLLRARWLGGETRAHSEVSDAASGSLSGNFAQQGELDMYMWEDCRMESRYQLSCSQHGKFEAEL